MTTLGIIGLGRIGAFHTETLANLAGVDGLVVTDERPDVVTAVAAKHGARPVYSVDRLLNSGIDGVVVAAATPAHAELTLAAVERGLPTFCEKPIAATASESARVAEMLADPAFPSRSDISVASTPRSPRRSNRSIQALWGFCTVRSTTMDPAPPPMEYLAGSGGMGFRDCAVHDFDVLRWITGQRALEVYATGSVQGDPRFAEIDDVDGSRRGHVREQDTRPGLRCSVQRPRLRLQTGDPRFRRHRGRWVGRGRSATKCGSTQHIPGGPAHQFFMDRFTDAFRAELAAFVDVTRAMPSRRARSPTPSKSRGWPRRLPNPFAGVRRCASTR